MNRVRKREAVAAPRSMMVEPMMPIARDRLPPSVMEPMRPFPSRLLPSNVYRLDPLFFSRSGSMFQCEKL
ncbi:hypothetical protein V1478_018294 [Vespula squamosa]|uniref:Uncharacterized protein n=1 Tax=Vespula squamosa TaxID=30214 RepID=A0ABD1ZUN5_VESSQ